MPERPPAKGPRSGSFPRADRVPPPPSRPQTELYGINRSLDDLTAKERRAKLARQGNVVGPLVAVAVVIIAMLVIAGWVLIGWPSSR